MSTNPISQIPTELLKVNLLRNAYCWARYQLRKGRMKTTATMTNGVGEYTIKHNMAALSDRAAFGMDT